MAPASATTVTTKNNPTFGEILERVWWRLDKALDDTRRLIAAGRKDEARKVLLKLDARFGGLAGPRSVELAQTLAGG